MRITRLVAESGADPADWMDWLSAVALTLGLPDPLPEDGRPIGPDGVPVPDNPNLIVRTTTIALSAFPVLLRPSGVPVERRSVSLTMIIRRALVLTLASPFVDGIPTSTIDDRGWECDIIIACGPGRPWDVNLLPDIITMSVMTNGTLEWDTATRGPVELPCTPDGWAVVEPVHPTIAWATYQPLPTTTTPIDPPTPGAP